MGHLAKLDLKDLLEMSVTQDTWVHQDREDLKALRGNPVKMERLADLEILEKKVSLAQLEVEGSLGHLDLLDSRATEDMVDFKARKEKLEPLAQRERQVPLGQWELLVQWVHRGCLERGDGLALAVFLVNGVPLETSANLDQWVH